jgi:hypothetical protein
MMPFYESFFATAPQLKILIYSGDTDIATCPHACTPRCVPLRACVRVCMCACGR